MRSSYKLLSPLISTIITDKKLNTVVKNHDFPACVNCLYFKEIVNNAPYAYSHSEKNIDFFKCQKFASKNLVSGNIEYEFASKCRNNENLCKNEGIFFTPKRDA